MPNKMNNYIEDDWNDNKLEDRDNPEKGIYYSYNDSGTGDLLKGVYRPVWTKDNESNGSIDVNNGTLELDGNGGNGSGVNVKTRSTISSGLWMLEWTLSTSDPSPNGQYFSIAKNSDYRSNKNLLNGYNLWWDEDGSNYSLFLDNDGSTSKLISSSWTPDTKTHDASITRNSYGNFELFKDGSSQGTSIDTTFRRFEFIAITNEMEKVSYDNFVAE